MTYRTKPAAPPSLITQRRAHMPPATLAYVADELLKAARLVGLDPERVRVDDRAQLFVCSVIVTGSIRAEVAKALYDCARDHAPTWCAIEVVP